MAIPIARCLRRFGFLSVFSAGVIVYAAATLHAEDANQPPAPEAKAAEAPAEAKPAEAAPAPVAETKPAETPPAAPAESKPAETPPAEPKPAETPAASPAPAAETKPAETPPPATPAEAKPAEAPPAEPKPAETSAAKPAETPAAAPAEAKPAEMKPAETPPAPAAETKPAEAAPAKPAEEKPAEPAPAPKAPEEPPVPDFNYEELPRPPVVRRLKLTEAQQTQITAALSERADALAKASEAERAAVRKESDKKLAAVLTAEQMAEFAVQQAEPRLRFNFRFQRWADVMDWIAEQADLSLVIDAPPPGTFNYTDTREYTPSEAIDLLNSVLITKGYALIRRDRMLVVVDLKQSVPEDMIPRVAAAELDQRGKFELVSTLFPLGARDAEAVEKEIAPLLGPHGKAVLLPATKQMLVTTTAGAMQAIGKVIESIPEPQKPQPKPETPAEKPVLTVHPVGGADPPAVMEVIKALFPSANIVLDPKIAQINAYAPPSQQEAIKKVLEQMQGQLPDEKRPKLEVYTVDQPGADQLITTIKSMLPEAQLSTDPTTGKLVAWAKPADQETIKTTLEKLRGLGSPDQTRQLQVYHLTRVDPTNAQTLLATLVPNARLSVDTRTHSLIALATAADQQTIKATLDQLQPGEPGSNVPELRLYPADEVPSAAVLAALTQLVPDAQVTPEPEKKRLMVVATPAEHEVIKKTLDQATDSPANTRQLVAYPIDTADPTSALSMLQSLLPTVQFVLDPKTNRLLAWARPSEQEAVKTALLQIQADATPGSQPRFEVYPIQKSQAAEILSTLQTLIPNARLSLDPKSEKLVAWGTPSDHQQIQTAIEKLQFTASPQTSPQLEVYRLSKIDPSATVTTLQPLVPDATLSIDPATRTLVALAVPADQETIRATLEQLQSDKPMPDAPELRYYTLKQRAPATLVPGLQQLAPLAQITLSEDGLRIMVVAPPSQHEAIKTSLDQIAATSADERQLAAYPLQSADPTSTVTMLESLLPTARFVVDAKTNRLLAWALPSEQEAIHKALAQIETDAAPGSRPRFEAYPIPKSQSAQILATLQTLVPTARLTLDPQGDKLVAWGNPSDHEQIKAAIEKLQATVSLETTPQLEVYRLTKADPSTTVALLQGLLPNAQLTIDATARTLVALAVPEDQQTIRAMLEQLQSDERAPNAPELRYYTLKQRPPATLITGLQTLAPAAQITLSEDGLQMMVVAPPAEHDIVKATIEKVETTVGPEEQSKLAVYQVTPSQKTRFQAILPNLTAQLPGMQVITDATPGELSVWAKPAQQQVVAGVIEELKRDAPAEGHYELVAYPIKAADPETVMTTLQSVFPNVQFVVDKKTRRIMVWTHSQEQEAIRAAIEQMDSAVPAESRETYKSYPIAKISPQIALQALQEQVPDAKLIQEPTSNRIIAWAIPADHKRIAETLAQMQQTEDGLGPKLVVYPTGDMDATALSYLLRTLVPTANVVVDSKTGGLAAFAVPEDHATIQATIDEMSKESVAGDKPTMVAYSIENMTAADAQRILAVAVPKAQLSQGADAQQLVAWAEPSDQLIIKELVERIAAGGPPETAPRIETYDIGKLDPTRASYALRAMAPSAIVSPGVNPGQMIAWGRPADHEKIKEALAKLTEQGPPENAPSIVVYPLEEVTASSVLPLLQTVAPQAQLSVGSTPNLLVAYARPADHEVIKASLAQVDIEDPDKRTEEVVVYTVKGRQSSSAYYTMQFLRGVVPDATYTLGTGADQLVVWAKPEDHRKIAELVKQLTELPPDQAPTVAVYTLDSALTYSGVTQVLSTAVPEARLTTGTDPQQLIAFASPDDQKTIEEILAKLSAAEPVETAPTMVVYALKNVQATDAMRMLSPLVPQAKLNQGSDSKQLVAFARPADHEVIKTSLEKIDAADNAATVAMYTLKGQATYANSYYTLAFLRSAVPEATFTVGADASQMIVWAKPEQHERIKQLVEEFSKELPPEETPTTVVYTVATGTTASSIVSMVTSAVPSAKLSVGTDPQQLVAYAKPADHLVIREMVDKLSAAEPAETAPMMMVYSLKNVPAQDAIRMLSTIVPQAKLNQGSDPKQLVAYARPADHEVIRTSLEKIDAADNAATVAMYKLKGQATYASSYYTLAFLRSAVPEATFTVGADASQLIVWAKPEQHERIKQLVEEFSKELPPEETPTTVVYTVANGAAVSSIISMVTSAVPDAKLSVGTDPQQLVAYAKPADHLVIREMVDKLSAAEPAETAPMMMVYPLKNVQAQDAIRMLVTIVPQAKLNQGSDSKQLVAYARPADHEVIKTSLEKIDAEDNAATVAMYKLKGQATYASSYYTLAFLRSAVPEATFTVGADASQLIVWAKTEQHDKIKQLVEEFSKDLPPEETPTTVVYTLGSNVTAAAATQMLRTAVPEAGLSIGADPQTLIAFAKPADHKIIEQAVEKLSAEEPADTAPTMAVYTLTNVEAQDAIRVLSPIVPQAKLNTGSDPKQLVAYARPGEHAVVKQSLAEIDKEDQKSTAVVYTLKGRDGSRSSYYFFQFLNEAIPEANFTRGADPNQLVVWATPAVHEKVKQLVDELTADLPPEETPTTVVYTVAGGATASSLVSMVTSAVPDAKLSVGADPQQLVAFAKPADHAVIQEMVDKLSAVEPAETAPTVVVYPLRNVQAQDAIRMLGTIVPQAKLNTGSDSKQLVAYARPADHAVIKASLEKIDAEDNAATAAMYTLKGKATYANSYYTLAFLRSAVPEATFTVGADSSQLVVWAKPEQHEKIKQLVEEFSKELPPEETPTTVVYTLGSNVTAAAATQMLRTAVPEAGLSIGADPQTLIAFAKPADHKIIEQAVERLSAQEPADTAPTMAVYPLTNVEAQSAIRVLSPIVPQAKLNTGSDPKQLVAYARPADHAVIKQSLAEIDKEDQKATAVVYTLKGRDGSRSSYYFYQFLNEAIPEANFTRGADGNQLVVWATPAVHEKVKQLVNELTADLPPEETPTMAVYRLEATPAQSAMAILRSAFPEAEFSNGDDPRTVIAWAKPADHKKIEAAVAQLAQETPSLVEGRTMAVYPLKGRDATALLQVLQPVIRDHAQIAVDPNRNSLIVWADKSYHESIKKTIDEFSQQISGIEQTTSRVYRFETADPQAAYTVLSTLVPEARIALDAMNNSLVVSAMPEDHEKIQATVKEMDREDQSHAPRAEVYRLTAADPTNLLSALTGIYRRRNDVQLSLDEDNGSLIAIASPLEQKKIRELIDQIEKLATGESAASLKLYSLENVDSDAALEVLTGLMRKQGAKVRLSVEPRSEQLVAFARPEQHKLIESTLEQLRSEEDQFEIYQLDFVDPMTAELAISRLFSDDYWTAPVVDLDPVTQQLFIRGKPDQLEKIRQLLIKMGETNLTAAPGSAGGGNLRTIRVRGDVQATIAEIRRVWPQLRQNDLQIFDPSAATSPATPAKSPKTEAAAPATESKKPQPKEAEDPFVEEKSPPKKPAAPAEKPAAPAKDQSTRTGSAGRGVFRLVSYAEAQDAPADAKAPPVVIMPGDGQITIASDDPEALDQLENLLRSLSEASGEIGRNFHIFPLKHTNAFDVAETVEDLFRENQNRTGWRRGMSPVVVVPDERMNAILVQANRTDRATIENLLKVIDTDEVPASPDAQRPRIIPIRNADAERVVDVVQDVFRSHLTQGTRRSSRSNGRPGVWTPQVTVDRITNSLVVMAPAPLVDDISELAQSLDEAAGSDPARAVTLVPLKQTNSDRVQEALNQILRGSRGRRYRGSN